MLIAGFAEAPMQISIEILAAVATGQLHRLRDNTFVYKHSATTAVTMMQTGSKLILAIFSKALVNLTP